MIQVSDLNFSYTSQPFIRDVNFEVKAGEIFGFLGPSGAGKSTLQKILIGMLPRYSGSVLVNGTEVSGRGVDFYNTIGVDFEFPTFYEKFTALENLRFFASLYDVPTPDFETLLSGVGLWHHAHMRVGDYSKGMKSRLGFVKSIMHGPQTLFLDEPTSGLDPNSARAMKEQILRLKSEGCCIVLTTHNMHDAAELCDRVAFIVDGKIVQIESPSELHTSIQGSKVKYTFIENGVVYSREICLDVISNDSELSRLISSNKLLSIHSFETTLEDLFVEVTGRNLI